MRGTVGKDKAAKPILLLAHIDVVEAKREDWQRDPFKLVEENGWFYARGASDDKAMAAILTDSLIRYKQEGYRPRRDLKLALTCGEETAGAGLFDSVRWLVQTRPEVLSAAFAINEGAGGELDKDGKAVALQIQAGEKVYQDFALEAVDPGGHSSRPTQSNAIVRLSAALAKLGTYNFPIGLNTVTRSYFEAMAKLVEPEVAADMRAVLKSPPDEAAATRLWSRDPSWNAMLRTTCIVSMIEGGHAPNALPQRVKANVNCRILPGTPVADVQAQIVKVIADDCDHGDAEGRGRGVVADAAAVRGDRGAGTQSGRKNLARRRHRADDAARLYRRKVSQPGRRPHVWTFRSFRRRRRQLQPRTQRAHARAVAHGRATVPLRSHQAVRGQHRPGKALNRHCMATAGVVRGCLPRAVGEPTRVGVC